VDTRQKITASTAGLRVPLLVTGYFDPLTSVEAARLAALGEGLTVAVLDLPDALLPLQARAELVASLRNVSRVIAGAAPEAESIIDLTSEHLAGRDALARRIVSRPA
jgi:hypothetical protein